MLTSHEILLMQAAAAIAGGDEAQVRPRMGALVDAKVEPIMVDELLLQSVLTVGWPRALIATGVWRQLAAPGPIHDVDADYTRHAEWTQRGERTCQLIYGANYEQLRLNVRALHPALEAWMITEGYGRTLSRPGLATRLRELATVAQTAVLGAHRQLHSHLLGALHSGATAEEIDQVMELALASVPPLQAQPSRDLWNKIRDKRAGS